MLNTHTSQKFKIKIEGVYVLTAFIYIIANQLLHLKINNVLKAMAPYGSTSDKGSSIIYTCKLNVGDIVEFTTTGSLKREDAGVTIFKL